MNIAVWIMQGILAAWFLMPATMKLISPKEKMIEKRQLKPNDSVMPVRILGLLELLGVIGIIIPSLKGILPILTPLAAIGFSVVMAGAFVVHYNRKEYKILPLLVLAFILSLVVAYYRFKTLTI